MLLDAHACSGHSIYSSMVLTLAQGYDPDLKGNCMNLTTGLVCCDVIAVVDLLRLRGGGPPVEDVGGPSGMQVLQRASSYLYPALP